MQQEKTILNKSTFLLIFIGLFLVLTTGMFFAGNNGFDIAFFVSRIDRLANSISDNGFLFAIQEKINFSDINPLGYSIDLFYGNLLLIPAALLKLIGIPSIISYKITIFFGILLTWFTTFYCSKKVFKEYDRVFLCVTSFAFAFMVPHLGDFIVAKTIKPIFGFCVPLGMYNLYQIFNKKENVFINMLGLTLAVAFNLLNHNLTTITLCIVLLVEYLVLAFKLNDKKEVLKITAKIAISAILCLGLCAGFVLPMLEQSSLGIYVFNYGQVDINGDGNLCGLWSGVIFNRAFAQMINIDAPAENNGGYLFYFLILAFLMIKKKDKKYTIITIAIITLMLILSIIPLPSVFSVFQFRSRLYALFNPALILLIIWGCKDLSKSIQNKTCILLIICLVINLLFVSILYGSIGSPDFSDTIDVGGGDYYVYNEEYAGPATVGGYYWHYDQSVQKEHIENTISSLPYEWEYLENGIKFVAPSDESIVLPLTYYKGYKVFTEDENGQLIEHCQIDEYTKDGLMVINKQFSSNQSVYVLYTGTTIQKICNYISIFTAIILLVVLISKKRKSV